MTETITKQKRSAGGNLLYIFSPCVLAVLFSAYVLITSHMEMEASGGWSYLGVIIFSPVLYTSLAVAILLRLLFWKLKNISSSKKTFLLWLIELVACVIMYFIWLAPALG
ncbi:MAG: hypothetical protein ABUL44_00325 [Flavobacterium sp.]